MTVPGMQPFDGRAFGPSGRAGILGTQCRTARAHQTMSPENQRIEGVVIDESGCDVSSAPDPASGRIRLARAKEQI
jgi:hypothetical protein